MDVRKRKENPPWRKGRKLQFFESALSSLLITNIYEVPNLRGNKSEERFKGSCGDTFIMAVLNQYIFLNETILGIVNLASKKVPL